MLSFLAMAAMLAAAGHAAAQNAGAEPPVSQCLAVAQALPNVIFAAAAADDPLAVPDAVTITFAGHSTYRIESSSGVVVATDFSGVHGAEPPPRVITMNRAHSTHYTLSPDARIEVVLPGWNPDGPEPARHNVVVDDVYIRNVTTDIRGWGDGGMIPDANSIFIFELAGLCIGHLGHLHHALTEAHYAEIGRLDIVMVPVDGGLTLSHTGMAEITTRLRSSIVLPMHLRGTRIQSYLSMMSSEFAIDFMDGNSITVTTRDLPARPTIMVPAGLASRG
ncbi:MBL fold metallo-hydrolase [Oricola cellulosilytica]|uniref:Zn-dependent hydrolase n=1 Tax=Oricola cellulosilytica TaxID=1429082 RepID=A0A4R0PFR6_9HYPH|nr:MBL fold metallo-hydrolase [Oricola cellulosilytica]TCD15449.1 Zn-dependent hydrolase [Oricola cellulosilytica]